MHRLSRRTALQSMLAAGASPFVWRLHAAAAPSENVLHASFGASGMAGSDIGSLSGSKNWKLITQMGIQIHSARNHKLVVKLIHDGAIGKVKEVHSWSGKSWGDPNPRPKRTDPVPAGLNWDLWLGVAAERPFIQGYYHPGEW